MTRKLRAGIGKPSINRTTTPKTSSTPITREAKAIGTFQTKGAVIRHVEDASPAAHAGLQPEDVVTAIDDQPVTDRASLQNLIGASVPGQTVALLVERANHRGSLQLVRVEVG